MRAKRSLRRWFPRIRAGIALAPLLLGCMMTQLSCQFRDENAVVAGFPNDLAPAWSADGKEILFYSDRSVPLDARGSLGRLFRVSASGGPLQPLGAALPGVRDVSSCDGGRTAIVTTDAGPIALGVPSGKRTPLLTPGLFARDCVPSCDGQWIYGIVDREDGRGSSIWRRRLPPGSQAQLELVTRVEGRATALSPSPDGKLLAFSRESVDSREQAEILVGLPGSGAFRPAYRCPRRIGRLSWFPDGKRLFVQQAAYDPSSDTTHRIVAIDGGDDRPLRYPADHPIHMGTQAAVSPDGKRIVFTANLEADEGYFLYTCALDGTDLQQITVPAAD